jgi:hypothetical protein
MSRRIGVLLAGVAIVVVAAIALVVYLSSRDIYTPRPEAYDLSSDGRQITVAFCGSNADTIDAQTLQENDRSVVVGIRLRQNRNVFQHGTAHTVTFTLKASLGNRIVRDGNGTPIRSGQYVCPG